MGVPTEPNEPSRFWRMWTRVVCARPALTLSVCVALAIAGMILTAMRLEFEPDRNALISPEIEWNRRFIDWRKDFPGTRDLVIAIDAGEGGVHRREAGLAAASLGAELSADSSMVTVTWGAPASEFSPKAARLLPLEEFESLLASTERAGPLVRSPSVGSLIASIAGALASAADATSADPADVVGDLRSLRELLDQISIDATDHPGALGAWLLGAASEAGNALAGSDDAWQYLESPNGRLLFVRLSPLRETGALHELKPAIWAARGAIERVRAEYPALEMGLTGIEVIEADETRAATRDSAIASVIALVVIAAIMIAAFHSVRTPLLLVGALLIGIAWSFAFLTLSVGHLQILSVVFVVILLGLGVDFGIHIASTFETVRHEHPEESFTEALSECLQKIGPGVITGAVTTAIAFFITTLTEFSGVAEMGIIAGGGILLCLLAMLTVYPALKRVFGSRTEHVRPLDSRSLHVYEERWSLPFSRRWRATLAGGGLLTLSMGVLGVGVGFDYNLPALLPRGLESVEWQQRVTRDGGVSIWSATSIAPTLDEARERAARFRSLDTVEAVRGIGLLEPSDPETKLELLREARTRIGLDSAAEAGTADLRQQLDLLSAGVSQALRLPQIPAELRPEIESLAESAKRAAQSVAGASPERLAALESGYTEARASIVGWIGELLDPSPLQPTDLPGALLAPSIAIDGNGYALTVYPRLPTDGSITTALDPRFLPTYMESVLAVDPEVTGVVVQLYESADLIRRSFLWAGAAAFIAVSVVVLVVFRSLADAALSLAPVVVGFVVTFGLLELGGGAVTPANIIVLPLLFGIGIDAGVHIVHRYRESPDARPLGLTSGTGKGITVTSLTTMAGFASMMTASHRGIAGLGMLLTVGIGVTMLSCWILLPALLELRSRIAALRR